MITFSKLGKMGRLGNQLFQISSTMGIAKNNNIEVGFPDWYYNKFLKKKIPSSSNLIIDTIYVNNFCYNEINLTQNTDIIGYLQSYRYFDNIDISELFSLNDEYREILKKFDFNNSVSMHIRRGDYLNNQHLYPILGVEYYKKSLNALNDMNIHNPKIYIFSDDINWCKDNFRFENQIFIERYDDIIELFIMSECTHNIISNSTFSWWAAYLNKNINKKVFCPDVWFKPCDEIKNFIYDDLIPKEWIKINI